MRNYIIAAISALLIVGCASTPIYERAEDLNDFGYSDQKIEENRYRVSYNGDASTPRAMVENYLLYRMSEITLEQDYDYFKVIDTDTECHTEYETLGDQPCTRANASAPMFPYCGFGYVCNPSQTIRETKRYEAVASITLHNGEKPAEDPHAFSALAVQENLRDEILRE
ncbi:MAG: hypothetical protein AAGL97_04395 [Pseudomonadota bacterium]